MNKPDGLRRVLGLMADKVELDLPDAAFYEKLVRLRREHRLEDAVDLIEGWLKDNPVKARKLAIHMITAQGAKCDWEGLTEAERRAQSP